MWPVEMEVEAGDRGRAGAAPTARSSGSRGPSAEAETSLRSRRPCPACPLPTQFGGFADPGPQREGCGARARCSPRRAERLRTLLWGRGWTSRTLTPGLGLGLAQDHTEAAPRVSPPRCRRTLSRHCPPACARPLSCPVPPEAGRGPQSPGGGGQGSVSRSDLGDPEPQDTVAGFGR